MLRVQSFANAVCVLAGVAVVLALALSGSSESEKAADKATQAQPGTAQRQPVRQARPEQRSATSTPIPPRKGIAVPSFDIVRIEKTGDGVIAGRAEPGWKVSIETGGSTIASVTADRDGEWATVLRSPLPPGDHPLVLRAHAPDGTRGLVSDQTVMVSVAKQRREEAVVALSTPGRPTEILQAPKPPDGRQVSADTTGSLQLSAPSGRSADPRPGDASARDRPKLQPSEPARRAASPRPSAPTDVHQDEESVQARRSPGGRAASSGARPRGKDATRATTALVPAGGSDAGRSRTPPARIAAAPASPSGSGIKTRVFRAAPANRAAAAPKTEERSASLSGTATPPASPAEPPVGFDTVDYEQADAGAGRLFMAGFASPGARLLIYVDNEPVGQVVAEDDGRWVFSVPTTLPSGAHKMRADQVVTSGRVVSRAEVTFERTSPEALAVAAAETRAAVRPPAARSVESAAGKPKAAPAEPETRVAVAKPNRRRAAAAVRRGPATRKARKKVRKRRAKRRARRRGKPRKRRGRRVVVVESGDSLWQISRRIFGQGNRYTTIYRRNKRQIRDPNLIFPRQRLRVNRP